MRHSSTDAMLFNAAPVAVASGYSMQAKGTEAEIMLYGDVGESWFGGVTAKQFADDLKALGKVDTINLRINSPGGDVFDGLAIYRQLVDHKARVVAHIDGLAASIASVIAMSAQEIRIGEAAFMMVHDAWGFALGNAAEMRTIANLLDQTTASIRDVYAARTGQSLDKIKQWMSDETWFTASDAVTNGFATKLVDNMRLAARIDPSKHKFQHAPAALAARPNLDETRSRLAAMKAKLARSHAG